MNLLTVIGLSGFHLLWAPLNGTTYNGIYLVNGIKLIQIYKPQITLSYLTQVEAHSLIGIIRLMGSVIVWPKVIPLTGVQDQILKKVLVT